MANALKEIPAHFVSTITFLLSGGGCLIFLCYYAFMTLIPEIRTGQSLELLKELHILTREGKLNQDTRRKLKQVYHLFNFIEPLLKAIDSEGSSYTLVDHGAGKSYLGFILYDLFVKNSTHGKVIGIETRENLVNKSKELSQRLKFERMEFHHLSVEEATKSLLLPDTTEIVTALHACDTATDDAIEFALKKKAKFVVLVPCCQAEVASYFRKNKGKNIGKPLTELWRHPIHTREFGSHVTNVLRCLELESHGYQVTVTELIGWEHSMKNELILAQYKDLPRKSPRQKIEVLLEELNIQELKFRFLKD